ncbi:MAG: hypothetical protein CME38_13170 [Haliea sp.]|nr:hypothetical protein [Haliea sp.]|tara:strand:- start:1704 stop:2390 length:687 start_codon:yes stop_codon:yes gene_type:complete
MLTDSFRGDIDFLFKKLKEKNNFSFSKYADGELRILRNETFTNCDNWTFDKDKHSHVQKQLMESFVYEDDGYYVGINCPCCNPQEDVKWMRDLVKSRATWANVFVNANYHYYVNNFIPEYSNHDIILFSREDSRVGNLPFEVQEHVPITRSAFIDNFDLIESFPIQDYNNKLFLFCAGPLGNMLAQHFWKMNKSNTYLDIGSTLNPYLTEPNRGYLLGSPTIMKVCDW